MTDHRALADQLLAAPAAGPGFVAPRYDGRGIANLPVSILRAFGVADERPGLDETALPSALLDGARRVVCLIVDALGYRQLLDEIARQPGLFLGELIARDGVSFAPLTSVFPSTTVNATTTLNTAAQPAEHGILGYTLWLRELGAVTEMIRFGPYAGPWSFLQAGIDPADYQPVAPLDARLAAAGVAPYLVSYHEYRHSPLTRMQSRASTYVPYQDFAGMVGQIRAMLERPAPERMLIGAYYGTLDAICHTYGTGSPQHGAEVARISSLLKHELLDRVRRPDTLFLLLADHGHINCTPARTIDLVADHPALLRDLVVPPTGEGRARYLHARPGRRDAVRAYIAAHFGGLGTLLDADDALDRGLFGPRPPLPGRARGSATSSSCRTRTGTSTGTPPPPCAPSPRSVATAASPPRRCWCR